MDKERFFNSLNIISIYNNNPNNFVNNEFKIEIINVLDNFFPKLNINDKNIMIILTIYIINIISLKYHFEKTEEYYYQWKQNNYRDLKGAILLLLPFIDDKNNFFLLNKITDLNQLLYSEIKDKIPKHILELERNKIFLSTYFEYGNMGIGLMDEDGLTLKIDNMKLIYDIIYHNLLGLLQTLEITNGKTYINWINIVPLNIDNYINSKIFNTTKNRLNQIEKTDNIRNILSTNMTQYSGLWIGDFYNILRNRFYEQGKKIKWLFFPYEDENSKEYLIQKINKYIDLNFILNTEYNNYNDLLKNDQDKFIYQVNEFIKNINYDVTKYLLIYIINNSNKQFNNNIILKFKLINTEETIDDDFEKIDLDKISNLTNEDILECIKYMSNNDNIGIIWNYLKTSLNQLENSAYSKLLIEHDDKNYKKITKRYYYKPLNNTIEISTFTINIKNIYNIAKSLSHINLDNWILLESNYLSLDHNSIFNFFKKINNIDNYTEWINLKGNLNRQYGRRLDKSTYDKEMKNILNAFKYYLIYIIFEDLVTNGLLNKFVLNREITDKLILPLDFGPRKDKIKELLKKNFNKNKEWNDSYYYLTNNKFKFIPNMRLEKKKIIAYNEKYDEMSYFDIISKDHEWPIFYAMDWISQISFFQHYIYHQVLYVTGATGQGKSTQVPKLLLYALKMIDYKSNGKVICTQPRIPPTVGNATRISDELGLPIEKVINNSSIKLKTNNYQVQFKHQEDNHTNNNIEYNSLKIVTDGTLITELKNNIVLKTNINNKYINSNVYDIIIVDESHEHGMNMDLIIALARQSCYFNNQIRLIIVSATMDDDEPIYRRYFNEINDNLLYPIKNKIIEPFLNQSIYLKINYMDRRYHISPPGETTQYRVEEHYLDYDPIILKSNNSIDYRLSANKAQQLGYKKIIEICEKSQYGEILFFANGEREILEAVQFLNNNLPPGNIALPYFSKLNQEYKNIISKIDIKISTIRNKRDRIHLEWGPEFIEDITIPLGLYKRSIIIATNVAEASVTIPNLAYVVDNGYAKVNIFKQEINESKLEVEEISESSRLQRKGRVGRIGDGTVYYMYKKNARINIKPKYKITQEDISLSILGLMSNKNIEDININDYKNYKRLILFDNELNINPNLNYTKSITIKKEENEYFIFNSNLYNIYIKNYNNSNVIRNKKMSNEFYVFNDGQIIDNILDLKGRFYLIHPFENSIKRNVLNNILKYNDKYDYIQISDYKYILNTLFSYNCIIDANFVIPSPNNYYEPNIIRTEIGRIIIGLEATTIDNAIILLISNILDCQNEVTEIKILCETISYSLSNLINKNINWDTFFNIYKTNSDILFIYQLTKNIKKTFNNLMIFKLLDNKYKNTIENIINEYIEYKSNTFYKYSSLKEIPTDFDINLWNKLNTLKNNGTYNEKYKSVIRSELSSIFIDDIEKNKNDIILWCDRNYINSDIIIKYLNFLVANQLLLLDETLNKRLDLVFNWCSNFKPNFYKFLTDYNIEEKIIRSFLYSKPYNFAYLDNNNRLKSFMNYDFIGILINNTKNRKEETLMIESKQIIFYLNKQLNENIEIIGSKNQKIFGVSIISYINPKWLISALPLIYITNINDIQTSYITSEDRLVLKYLRSNTLSYIMKIIDNNLNKISSPWVEPLNAPIISLYYNMVRKNEN